MITIQQGNNNPFMQGTTTLDSKQTIQYDGKNSLSVVCRCGKPFANSIEEIGIILNSVLCAACGKEIAYIVDMTELENNIE